jgi:beta-mannosidase
MATYSLDGQWTFHAAGSLKSSAPKNLGLEKWMPAAMPGTLHHALQKLGKIPDAFYGRNELDLQWIDEQDWEIRRSVRATAGDCRKTRQQLVFDGIDTVAEIFLNNRKVGSSENMFRQVVCDVKGLLKPGANEIRILLKSPTAYAKDRFKRFGDKKGPHWSSDKEFVWQTGEKRETRRVWIRKVQCHFGWDWGLYLAVSGLWQPARLECSDAPRFASLQTAQTHKGPAERPHYVEINVTARLEAQVPGEGHLTVNCGGQRAHVFTRLKKGENVVKTQISIPNPKLWWPAGQGAQPLYELEAVWEDAGGSKVKLEKRVGLRSLELVTRKDKSPEGKPAESFFFQVNGRPIYAKGANWIPADSYVDRCTPEVYRHLLQSMVEANMNMVRVWGGGTYELDAFYDLCDELGILVWQDFMMACALYPDTEEFLRELTAEAQYQVRRLFDHPSIALWCGDNENSAAVMEWWKESPDPKRIQSVYARVMNALWKTCEKEDTTRRFWLSSPSNQVMNDPHPNNPNIGDVHYWNVWHGGKPFNNYLEVKPRFASEFGFQSFPETRTIEAVVAKEDRNPSSWVMEHHQRSYNGNMLITNTIAREMPIPKDFESYCWASQINHATAMKTAVEHWRRIKPWCMGALYWQVNDLWPVASWSSIDYYGRWKALHHEAARFFAPLLASITQKDGKISVWATSDIPKALTLRGSLEVYRWDGKKIAAVPLAVKLKSLESRSLFEIAEAKLLGGKALPREVCCFVELKGDGVEASNFAALVPWKWANLSKPQLKVSLSGTKSGVALSVQSKEVAPYFHAELKGLEGHFAGDWRVLKPGKTYKLPWVAHGNHGARIPSLGEAKKRLKTLSLYDLSDSKA